MVRHLLLQFSTTSTSSFVLQDPTLITFRKPAIRIYSRALSPEEVAELNYLDDPDSDGDGLRNRFETGTGVFVSDENTGTDPQKADSDDDGLSDREEVTTTFTDPNNSDTDGDSFKDGFEHRTGFDPLSDASVPELLSEIHTAIEFRFNAALGTNYRIEGSPDLEAWATVEDDIDGTGESVVRLYSIVGQPMRYFRARVNP